MLSALFWMFIGALIGWNFPQPQFAQKIQDTIVNFFHNLFDNVR